MGQLKWIFSLTMIALFAFAFVTFAVTFAIDNNAAVSLADDSDFTGMVNTIEDDIEVFYQDSNDSSEGIGPLTIGTQTEATEGGAPFKIGPWTAIKLSRSAIQGSYESVFGSDSGFSVILTAFLALMSFTTVYYIYKLIAGRNPD